MKFVCREVDAYDQGIQFSNFFTVLTMTKVGPFDEIDGDFG